MSADVVRLDLSEGARHTLYDLLDGFIHARVWEAARSAETSTELQRAGEKAIRLGQLRDFAAEGILRGDLKAHATDLTLWLMEAEGTAEENDKLIADLEQDESPDRSATERAESIANVRRLLVTDWAHQHICSAILDALYAHPNVRAAGVTA
jgi:hypothetical protein